jgi:hypothetical protein
MKSSCSLSFSFGSKEGELSLLLHAYIYISKLSLPFRLAQEGKTGNQILSISLFWFSLGERRKGKGSSPSHSLGQI